jgi:hypothetical protein
MKRGAPNNDWTPDAKRSRVGDTAQNAFQSGSTQRNSEEYQMNMELSTLPEKTLYADTAELARSTHNTQETLINTAIGAQWGQLGNGRVGHKALPLTLFNGAVAPTFPEIQEDAENWPNQPDVEFMAVDGRQSGVGGRPSKQTRAEAEAGGERQNWKQGNMDGGAFQSRPWEPQLKDEGEEKKDAGRPPPPPPGGDPGGDKDDDEQKKEDEANRKEPESRYMAELRPFLPIAGGDIFRDSKPQQEAKALNLALFNNIIRNPGTGDCNVNPLQMGTVIQDSWRFSGDNKIFDYVFPGGSLNLGSLPVGTERLCVPDDTLEAEHAKIICSRNVRNRLTKVNEYYAALQNAAARAMPMMETDIQWTNNNKDVKDDQHVAWSNNTMPLETDYWEYRPQIGGEVPLQDNLLPAQALQTNRIWDTSVAYMYDPQARSQPVFNPPTRFGWNPWTSFY